MAAEQGKGPARGGWGAASLGLALAVGLAPVPPAAADDAAAPKVARATPAGPRRSPEKAWGVRPLVVTPAAGGHMLYFRYKVVDARKAKALFDRRMKPYVVDRETGTSLGMPEDTKLGALRSSPKAVPANGRDYYVLFANYTHQVKRGSKVDVVMGGCRFENLVVE
jgi:hypothetical protein